MKRWQSTGVLAILVLVSWGMVRLWGTSSTDLGQQDEWKTGLHGAMTTINANFDLHDRQSAGLIATNGLQDEFLRGLNATNTLQNEYDRGLMATNGLQDEFLRGLNATNTLQNEYDRGLMATNGLQDEYLRGLMATNGLQDEFLRGLNATNTSQDGFLAGLNTTNGTQDTRLDGLGATNTTQDTRLDGLGATNTTQDTLLAGLEVTNGLQKTAINGLITYLSNGLLVHGTLAITTPADQYKTTSTAVYTISGVTYTKAATDNLEFSAADTINKDSTAEVEYGIWLVQINAAGTVSTKPGGGLEDQKYTSSAAAISNLPAVDSGNVSLGYILVESPSGTPFTCNTTALTTIGTFSNTQVKTLPSSL